MVIDHLQNAAQYYGLGNGIEKALRFLQENDLLSLENGKHTIVEDRVFAIVQEYETKDPAQEKLESHRRFIDVQYVVKGEERMGHALLQTQIPSRAYNPDDDYMLFDEAPDFFSVIKEGMFTIFFPNDLHMPCIQHGTAVQVKKIVFKIAVGF
ncbi:MAG: YhcH/YjgK/YiaL family protein [Bacteroidota bacterium]